MVGSISYGKSVRDIEILGVERSVYYYGTDIHHLFDPDCIFGDLPEKIPAEKQLCGL